MKQSKVYALIAGLLAVGAVATLMPVEGFRAGSLPQVTIVVIGAFFVAIWCWPRKRAPQPDRCPHCNYSLTGLPPNSSCPECGRRKPAAG